MRCHIAAVLAGAICLATPALSDDALAPGRYALGPSKDGFVRLDTRTGAVSHCSPTDGVWRCDPLPQETAMTTRLNALSAEVEKLSAALAALDARVAGLAPIGVPTATMQPPSSGTRVSVAGQAIRRLFDAVRRLKHGEEAASQS